MRDSPNVATYPRDRPVIEHRLRIRSGAELRGSFCSPVCAASFCASVDFGRA